MKIAGQAIAVVFAVALLFVALPVHSGDRQDEVRSSSPTPPALTTCAELAALGDRVELSSREVGMLKQHCDLEDIRAKFANLDRNRDGYLKREELPADHMLSQDFDNVDLDEDKRLSLAEVAEYDAEIARVE